MCDPPMQTCAVFQTAHGFCGIAWSPRGVTRLTLPAPTRDAAERLLRRKAPDAAPGAPTPDAADVIEAVQRYFDGKATDFSTVTLDLFETNAFVTRIYAAVRLIPWGATTTYGALARDLGADPQAARDIGAAMAANPAPPVIPCHRVLAAGGKPGGFSAPGGVASKIRMLEMEGVRVAPPAPAQHSFEF